MSARMCQTQLLDAVSNSIIFKGPFYLKYLQGLHSLHGSKPLLKI